MSDETFRRLFWSAALLFSVAVWAFAIIGLRAVVPDPACLSVWTPAERAF
jgi:hypothetical protein